MALPLSSPDVNADIEPYRLHVSQRYLDLTRQKLDLARIPREPPTVKGETSSNSNALRDELEFLLDHWLNVYDHRAQETFYNERLPQFRTNLAVFRKTTKSPHKDTVLKVHFVHRHSSVEDAVPLLVCHDWGSSFIEVSKMIEGLCEPLSTPTPQRSSEQAFHVVCPSIPGFGFSDVSPDPDFGLDDTADVFDALMVKLGYSRYMLHGSAWGYLVCRTITLRHPSSCIGLHTTNVEVPQPALWHAPIIWASYHIARLTGAQYSMFSFGYTSSDFDSDSPSSNSEEGHRNHQSIMETLATRTQTLAYALADSPTGLLALTLNMIRSAAHLPFPPPSPTTSTTTTAPSIRGPWTPSDIIFWTMMYWLPGPEAAIRWLCSASQQSLPNSLLWRSYSPTPLAISDFKTAMGVNKVPPMWASAYHQSLFVRRHMREANRPAWEVSDELVMDLRAFANELRR